MLLSLSKNFIFVHIYKNAGTSIVDALLPFAQEAPRLSLAGALQFKRHIRNYRCSKRLGEFDPQPFHKHAKAREILNGLGEKLFRTFFSFAIVRNPWDWQVSLYTYILQAPAHPHHQTLRELGSFSRYIGWRCGNEAEFQKDFVYSQGGDLLVDYLGRFENLENDFRFICEKIGIETALPRLNVSNTTPYQEFYDRESRKLVEQTFVRDIEAFGYSFDS